MTKKIKRIRKLLRHSEYENALVRYHAARRRGDPAGAERWLKVADMHLRVADRFAEGVHAGRMREIEREDAEFGAVQSIEDQAAAAKEAARQSAYESLERRLDEIRGQFCEQAAAEDEADESSLP